MINYTTKQLYSFESVVRNQSFTKASKELFLTQPAVYMQIKQLSENVGSELLTIKGKTVKQTYIGQKLYRASVDIIDKLERVKVDIDQAIDPEAGHLQIAVATTTNVFASRVLARFKRRYPHMTFFLEVANRATLIDKLTNHEVDLVIMGEPPSTMDLATVPFMENPLIPIVHPKHQLLQRPKVTIHDLRSETLITREAGSGTRQTIERMTGLEFNSGIEINLNSSIIEAVQAGLGIGFVSKHTVSLQLEAGTIRQLNVEGFPLVRYWHIVHNGDSYLSPIASRFREFIMETSQEKN